MSIVTTSLVTITADIGGFDRAGWILSSYLLGFVTTFLHGILLRHQSSYANESGLICDFTGLVVIIAKLSDILGRKPIYIFCIMVYTIFSGACGGAKTIPQL